MYKIPLSVVPIDSAGLGEILRGYDGQPAMKLVEDFEARLKEFTGAKYVLALNSGTSAIHLALKALGVGPGDCVIAPTFTYVATINPIIYLGAFPVMVDSETLTWNMDPRLLEDAINSQLKGGKKPSCVIVVHSYGMPARMEEIQSVCRKYEIPILEDAAEAIGSKYHGSIAGTLGDAGIFSFNHNKILTTYGGGALITQNEGVYKKALFWASQSREDKPFYEHTDIGFNYRMGPLNAAAGILGMRNIHHKVMERRGIYEKYNEILTNSDLIIGRLDESKGYFSNRWLSTFLLNPLNINEIIMRTNGLGIECRRLWNPMHLQPFYQKYEAHVNGFAERLFREGICLPSCNTAHISQVFEALIHGT